MYLLPLTKGEKKRREELADKMWTLCRSVCPYLYLNMRRLSIRIHRENEEATKELKRHSENLLVIKYFGLRLHGNEYTFDFRYLWDEWLERRNILATYIDKEHNDIQLLDREYEQQSWFIPFRRRIPGFKTVSQPTKPLSREVWEQHPDPEGELARLARNLWNGTESGATTEELFQELTESR